MLPKSRRLPRRNFLATKLHGHPLRFPHFSLIYLPNNLGSARFSVVTSAKLNKKAVVRNRLRRLIYASLSQISISNLDAVLFPTPSMLNLPHAQISSLLHQALSKISLP